MKNYTEPYSFEFAANKNKDVKLSTFIKCMQYILKQHGDINVYKYFNGAVTPGMEFFIEKDCKAYCYKNKEETYFTGLFIAT